MVTDLANDVTYSRVADVLWRLAPDRVLLRHAGVHRAADTDDGVAADLMGLAAMVWVALDEPATAVELVGRLAEEDLDRAVGEVSDVAGQLVDAGWVRVVETGA